MAAPARITIELEPPRNARERWRARVAVPAAATPSVAPAAPATSIAVLPSDLEAGEPSVVPAAYEPPSECTCVEGWCDSDHEHE
jgi:hypothetical protein